MQADRQAYAQRSQYFKHEVRDSLLSNEFFASYIYSQVKLQLKINTSKQHEID